MLLSPVVFAHRTHQDGLSRVRSRIVSGITTSVMSLTSCHAVNQLAGVPIRHRPGGRAGFGDTGRGQACYCLRVWRTRRRLRTLSVAVCAMRRLDACGHGHIPDSVAVVSIT